MGEIKDELLNLKNTVEAEERAFNEDEQSKFDELENEYKECQQRAETAERLDRVPQDKPEVIVPSKTYSGKNVITRADRDKAFRGWALRNNSLFRPEYGDAAERCNYNLQADTFNVKLTEDGNINERSMNIGSDSAGGHLSHDEIVVGIERAIDSFWSWRNLVTVTRTDGNGDHRIVLNDDTGNEAAYNDELAATVNVDTTFSEVLLKAYKLTTGIFPVSNETFESTSINVAELVAHNIGRRLARKMAKEFTLGTTDKITGFTSGSVEAVEAASATAVTYGEIVDLYWALDEVHRNSPNCAFMCSSGVMSDLEKIVDGNGRPLLGPGLNGTPQLQIKGKPVIVNDFLPQTMALDAQILYFGDWSAYNVRMVRDVQLRTSTEKYFVEDAVAFLGSVRCDGKLVNPYSSGGPIVHLANLAS